MNDWNRTAAVSTKPNKGRHDVYYHSLKYNKKYSEAVLVEAFNCFWFEFENMKKQNMLYKIPKKPADAWERFLSSLRAEKIN